MKRTMLLILIILAAVSGVARERPSDVPSAPAVVAHYLGLSEEQVDAWNALLEELRGTVGPLREELAAREQDLQDALASDSPDPGLVGDLFLQIRSLRFDIGEAYADYHDGFIALLSDDQAELFQKVVDAKRLQKIIPAFEKVNLL